MGRNASEPSSPSADEREMARWSLAENERHHIVRVLDALDGNVAEATRVLGLSRSALYEKLRKHKIAPERRGVRA